MNFTDLLAAAADNPAAVTIPTEWAQGRASFGGLVAALQYQAMRRRVDAARQVRSLAITFVAPVAPEVPVTFDVEILREGSSVTQVLGRASQNGQVTTLVQGSFGVSRDSVVLYGQPPCYEGVKPREQSPALPFVKGVMPDFLQHLEIHWGLGSLPYSGVPAPAIGGYVRLRDCQPGPLNEAHVLALVDAWPPGLLGWLKKPAPHSSLTWTIEFIHPQLSLTTHDWCIYHAEVEHANNGYGHTAATLHSPEGELIAISRQTVTVFG
ncbi:thioesterase family protein [Pseudomonas sp. DTU_2021_1001937_2_SI_NGA_ILE_001]|uniref:acyl-CoA thioesterase n=1 Tax=Pseudomonas sp. DTU_2021_1001937_2_SI_NGA_ILE_001 TaxID=3077589 RepID=UPI0028FC14D4|nr:thioesterase family protein [Pseudomonas sp. DTU_2021_1001937_2_SI_NGA_ILE_001]WNW10740.1 thioesterase family protein [Pseudomonas sp. DTU_2021_1001937_2_SI_NGA_ILE_001]